MKYLKFDLAKAHRVIILLIKILLTCSKRKVRICKRR